MAMLQTYVEKWDGSFGIVPFTHFDPLDLCNQWRGNDLFYDYYDHASELRALLERATECIIELEAHTRAHHMDGYDCEGTFMGCCWTPGTYLSCDAGDMSSPDTLAQLGVPYTQRIVREWGGAFLHHHELGIHQIPTWSRCEGLTVQFCNRDANTDHLAEVLTDELLQTTFRVPLGFIATCDEFMRGAEFWATGKCVVTVNCARLGYLHEGDETSLFAALDVLLEYGRTSLELKRKVIQRHIDSGLFPYTKRYLGTLRNHFSTLGINGVNEMIRNFTDDAEDITTTTGHILALRLLDHVRERIVGFQEETGHLYNLEATPAEGTTYRFAREDRKRFPDIIQAGSGENAYYTNSSQLPVGFTTDPFKALMCQEELQCRYTGGTVLHLYLGERVSSVEACKKLVHRSLERFRLPYITVTPTFSVCPIHGYLAGEHEYCPLCDELLLTEKQVSATAV